MGHARIAYATAGDAGVDADAARGCPAPSAGTVMIGSLERAEDPMTGVRWLTDDVGVYDSSVTIGVIRDGTRALLVDCDSESAVDGVEAASGLTVTKAVFTHYHRDTAGGVEALARRGVDVSVPAAESRYFTDVEPFWTDPDARFRRYQSLRPHHLLLPRSVPVDGTLAPGDTVRWGDARITARSTPGHTGNGLSYLVDSDGEQYAFTGDLICDDGRLWDAYSLQHSTTELTDYHSFLGERDRLLAGLRSLTDASPAAFVPLRGAPIEAPRKAVDRLARRLRRAYRNYARIAALRHYYPTLFEDEQPPDAMTPSEGTDPPPCLRHVGTSWVLRSAEGPCLVVDCGSEAVIDALRSWEQSGEIDGVEGLWISHYHHDHVDAVEAFTDAYDCPVMAQREVADVLERPDAYRLPVLAAERVPIDRPLADGESWDWREWTLTARWFPGQTYYHGSLAAAGEKRRVLFAGDAFTMAGLDDYCTHNRNLLGPSRGFDRCLGVVEAFDPTEIVNCHVDRTFEFSRAELQFMRETLADRLDLFGELLAWEHPNFGLDPLWVRSDPYHQTRSPGDRARIAVEVTNHASETRAAAVRPRPPSPEWTPGEDTGSNWVRVDLEPNATTGITLPLRVPDVSPGPFVVPVDVRFGDRHLPRFREGLVTVAP